METGNCYQMHEFRTKSLFSETLSNNYEQPQDKHVLEDRMDVNISNDDGGSNLVHNSETDSDSFREPVSSSNKKDNEENCDEIVSSSENKLCSNDKINFEKENVNDEIDTTFNKSINSPNVSSTNLEEDENNFVNNESCMNNDEKLIPSNEEESDEKSSPESKDQEDGNSDCANNDSVGKENQRDGSIPEDCYSTTEDKTEETSLEDGKVNSNAVCSEPNPVAEENIVGKTDVCENITEEKTFQNKNNEENKDTGNEDKPEEVEKVMTENKESAVEEKDNSLLKETLLKQKESNEKEGESENNGTEDIEMDDDFDPSLLCPDIAMEVDEAPVVVSTDNLPTDGSKSPLLYEPVYSTYVDEMTGAEVTFNLSPEEHQMRQEAYGENNPIQFTKIHCTACNVHLGSALDGQGNRFVHPLLKVLICKDCYHFYTSGEFEKDEDGSELYCRWCGQGGQVICCSSCEMVFCKKCIRINFGRRKLTEIRDSDDWFCFRCNPAQLTELRVHCAEFMEYVRREISRAATLENATTFMTTDYSQCCLAQKKKYVDPNPSPSQTKKRKKKVDPDFDPDLYTSPPDSPKVPKIVEVNPTPTKVVPILPKTNDSANSGVVVQRGSAPGAMYRIGNTTYRPRSTPYNQIRPVMQAGQQMVSSTVRPQCSTPGYIKIMPGGVRATTSLQGPAQTFVSPSVRPQNSFSHRQVRPGNSNQPAMKHEWFEKTVRAAARVNSNLSYTLTQLNRAQATASSVEALAVVHNKLQEILSTSINSLIQIRKNLRTEFIAGIKNIRFPPKPPHLRPLPSTSAQDDDVIFVSPPTSPVPPPLPAPNNFIPSTTISPSMTLVSPSSSMKQDVVPVSTLQPVPSTSTSISSDKPKVFLRVKSLSALQNVTSECITIPDDPAPPAPPSPALSPIKSFNEVTFLEESPEKKEISDTKQNSSETKDESITKKEAEWKKEESESSEIPEKCDNSAMDVTKDDSGTSDDTHKYERTFDLSKEPSLELSKMLNIRVYLDRSKKIDELVRSKFGLVNGDTLDHSD